MKTMKRDKLQWLWIGSILIVAVLGDCHLADVKAGVLESGESWMLSVYGILAVCVIACLTVCGYLLCRRKDIKLETIYVFCAVALGIGYLFVLPPLSAPDEVSHYISAYRLSNQMMGKTVSGENGLVYIRQEDAFIEDVYGALEHGVEDPSERVILGQLLEQKTYQEIYEHGFFGEAEQGTAISNQWTVRTTPLAYVPQAIGFVVARLLHMSGIGLLFMGRFMNLIFYVGVTWMAMKKLPFGKEVLFGVALLPMTLHLAGSLSYDVMILALSFYFTAYCMDLAYRKERVGKIDILILAGVMAVLAPCKMVYAVLMGICLLIPVKKFGGWKPYFLSAAVVFGAFVLSMFLVNSQVICTYATETDSYISWAEEAGYSLGHLLRNPKLVLTMFYRTIVEQAEFYHLTMLGAYLGNIDVVINVPYLIIWGFTFGLLGLALAKPEEEIVFSRGQKMWIWFLVAACFGVILFSMLLAWTPVSSKIINGVQGRYFLPFLPVLLMTVKNRTIVLNTDFNRGILYAMCCANGYVLLRLFSIVCIRL